MINKHTSKEIIKHIKGTLIADMESLRTWVKILKEDSKEYENCGKLNYTIFLLSLIGCETLGMYSFGADLHENLKNENKTPDIGGYIIRFVEEYFPTGDKFKKISKILSDYLRHSLVHGFAPRKDGYPFDLSIVVSDGKKNYEPLSFEKNNKLCIQIDGVTFLNKVIYAFENKIVKEIDSNSEKGKKLANNFIKAEKFTINFKIDGNVINQFIAVYPKLNKK